ncbi:MAG: hypothetical protein HYU58_09855 [Proteobacteria bacterium]|nr:hypothetical protein [Pseudomonadota bacterium]
MNPTISADSAIRKSSEDLLGRADFARNIAVTIATWHGEESLVLAISGEWGVGKTSIKNMILEALSEQQDAPRVVEFEPWRWRSNTQITEAFFREIRIALQKLDRAGTKRKAAQKWISYTRALRAIEPSIEATRSGMPGALTTLATASVFGVALGPVIEPYLGFFKNGTVLLAISAAFLLLKGATRLVEYCCASQANEPDVETARGELREAFAGLDKPLLVVIDDIDRLTPREIRTVFRHVKANGSFPKLTYLLLYQQSSVEAALTRKGCDGAEYLQKIIQVSLNVPVASQSRLERVLVDGINKVLGEYAEPEHGFDNERWSNLYLDGIQHFIRHLRDVYRLLSALSVTTSFFRGNKAFEVNPLDLLALEFLRVFEPDLFQELRRSKRLLTSPRPAANDRDARKAAILDLVGKATKERKAAATQIVRYLFPEIDWAFEFGVDYTNGDEWSGQRRLCVPEYFDRYFYLSIPDFDISTSELNQLIEQTADAGKFRTHLDQLHTRGLRSIALSRLDSRKTEIPLVNAHAFLPALMSIGEVADDTPNWLAITEFDHCWRIVYWYLLREADPAARAALLFSATNLSKALCVPSRLILNELERQRKGSSKERELISGNLLDDMKDRWLEMISLAAYADPIGFCFRSHAGYLISAWKRIGGDAVVSAWAEGVSKTDRGLVSLICALATPSLRSKAGSHLSKIVWKFELSWISTFVDTSTWEARIEQIDQSPLSHEQRLKIDAYAQAEKARRGEIEADDL